MRSEIDYCTAETEREMLCPENVHGTNGKTTYNLKNNNSNVNNF